MKKKILLTVLLLQAVFLHAQSIGYLDLPVAGELWIEFKDTVGANIAITPSGTGQVWNYQSNFNVHDTILFQPQTISSVPNNIDTLYPQSTLVNFEETPGDYTFLKIDFTGMYIKGFHSDLGFDVAGFTLNDMNYSNDLLYIPIPFQLGDVVQNTATYHYIFQDNNLYPGANVRVTYTTFQDLESESQGELTTPLGNYPSVLRVREMITKNVLYEVDSFNIGNFYYLTDLTAATTTAYKWLKNGPNCVVMSAALDEFNNVLTASYYSSSGLVGNESNTNQSAITIMPNPVRQGENISINLNKVEAHSFAIFDLSGRALFQKHIVAGTQQLNIQTEKLAGGLYYLKVYNNNQTESISKFVVTE